MAKKKSNKLYINKMHSLGNDFVVIDVNFQSEIVQRAQNKIIQEVHGNIAQEEQGSQNEIFPQLEEELIKRLSHRHLGIGCDQLAVFRLEIERLTVGTEENIVNQGKTKELSKRLSDGKCLKEIHAEGANNRKNIKYLPKVYTKIYNQDGSHVSMCVNIVRCIARLINKNYGFSQIEMKIQDISSLDVKCINLFVKENDVIEVELHAPVEIKIDKMLFDMLLMQHGLKFKYFGCISVGNPHLILVIEEDAQFDRSRLGEYICQRFADQGLNDDNNSRLCPSRPEEDLSKGFGSIFPGGVNINFVRILSKNKISLEVYERGVGITYACGSGAAASFAFVNDLKFVQDDIIVEFKYGSLRVRYKTEIGETMNGASVNKAINATENSTSKMEIRSIDEAPRVEANNVREIEEIKMAYDCQPFSDGISNINFSDKPSKANGKYGVKFNRNILVSGPCTLVFEGNYYV